MLSYKLQAGRSERVQLTLEQHGCELGRLTSTWVVYSTVL